MVARGRRFVVVITKLSPKHRNILFMFLLFSFAMLLGCQSAGNDAGDQPLHSSIQFTWTHEYIFAPFYAAEKNGHFAQQNLAIELKEGGFRDGELISSMDEVLVGNADFGMANGYSILLAQVEGQPLVALASLLQRSPDAIISLPESGIMKPQDLVGKNVSVSPGGATWGYHMLLASQSIAAEGVNLIPRTAFGIEALVNDEVDALMAWYINEGIAIEETGYEATYILLSDYGVDTYPSVIFTTESIIAEKPELVERFLRAFIAGMMDTLNDPQQAAELALVYNDELELEGQLRRLQAALPFFSPAGSQPGMMATAVWQLTYQILLDEGVLTMPLDVDTVYDLTFLNTIYQN
jgi:ABC-type nitrate/sulfonate/bicarbonate transport system substrate-binding protein